MSSSSVKFKFPTKSKCIFYFFNNSNKLNYFLIAFKNSFLIFKSFLFSADNFSLNFIVSSEFWSSFIFYSFYFIFKASNSSFFKIVQLNFQFFYLFIKLIIKKLFLILYNSQFIFNYNVFILILYHIFITFISYFFCLNQLIPCKLKITYKFLIIFI